MPENKRVLIFIVAFNAERTIQDVVRRIPAALKQFDTHILVVDDSSEDRTFERAREVENAPFPITVLFNPVNQGYGGNQKLGFHFAIHEGFDLVALLHGDGQYAPECLPDLLQPIVSGEADAVFGSRMMGRYDALKGGMPLYKFVGNKILTRIQNRLLKASLSEFHSGYRVYSVDALAKIPFELNSRDFDFDTDIIIQLLRGGFRVKELPIPTYYGDEICHVNGMKYAWNVIKASLKSRAQDLGIFYERKFDLTEAGEANELYKPKWGYESPHTLALKRVKSGAKVLDVGCASGYMARALADKDCEITGIDQFPPSRDSRLKRFIQADLSARDFPVDAGEFDYVLLLDIIEHLRSPEEFVESLRRSRHQAANTTILVSTGNIAFIVTRLMLFLGQFHYGKRGILDLTHTRLFTFGTMRALFDQAGYVIEEVRGVPAPFPLALGDNRVARLLVAINRLLIRISRSLFSYQIFMVVRPLPSLEGLLEQASETSKQRVARSTQATSA